MTEILPKLPPEWAPQERLLIGWPSHPAPWEEPFEAAREEVASLAKHLINAGKSYPSEATEIVLVVDGHVAEAAARKMVPGAEIINLPCGDTWVRDTAPIFSRDGEKLHARSFRFNGWGGKYVYQGDAELSEALSGRLADDMTRFDFILEGGSVDFDGAGHLLTTEDCLLNVNRNKGWTREIAEARLKDAFGVEHIIWLKDGLLNDHTDSHVDNIARFLAPGHVVCQAAQPDDPHAERLKAVEADLRNWRGAGGEALTVTTIPSPGRVLDDDGGVMPASHMNFVITNQAVIVPVCNDRGYDAVEALKPFFPGREVIASSAQAILTGGGAFHCISQQIPAVSKG
jgi:agmatine deiminase